MTTANRKLFADTLTDIAKRIRDGYDPANGTDATDRAFERTGFHAIRAGVLMLSSGDAARRLAADWSARGYPSGGGDGICSSPDDTSVERAALTSDHWERTGVQLDLERRLIDDNTRAIEHRIFEVVKEIPPEERRAQRLVEVALDVDCANPWCDHKITGIGDDRPRAGRCERCYRFRLRNRRDWTPNCVEGAS